jgi:hypothetical protein
MAEIPNDPHRAFNVKHFVRLLPTVADDELPAGSQCMICLNPYNMVVDGEIEHAIRLDCQQYAIPEPIEAPC